MISADSDPVRDPLVSVVIVAWRRSPMLLECLRSVAREALTAPTEVIVVLNEPEERLRTTAGRVPGITVYEFGSNLGFGGAVNYAAARSRGEFVLLLNDDAIVEPGWLAALLDLMTRRPCCVAASGTFRHLDGSLQEAGSVLWASGHSLAITDESFVTFERQVDYASGGSMLVRRGAWEQVGGFDDDFYPAYFEDADLCLRLREGGGEVWYQPDSVVRHVRGASTSSATRDLLYETNRRRFVDRWGEWLETLRDVRDIEEAAWVAAGCPTRLLVIDDRIPTYGQGSGFGRMLDTVEALSSTGELAVSFHPTAGVGTGEGAPALRRLGVRLVLDLASHLATPGVAYDAVVISRPHNYANLHQFVRGALPDAPVIYDAEALYHRRLDRRAELAERIADRTQLRFEAHRVRAVEDAVLRDADVIVCISEAEADAVRSTVDAPVTVIEPWLAAPSPSRRSFHERNHIGLVAGWLAGSGGPNSDALRWFGTTVMPLVRARAPWAQLLVTGAVPPPDVRWLESSAIRFVGEVADLAQFYASIRVAISPTRFGAGVKLKTVEAIQYAVPVVATSEGAAGLDRATMAAISVHDDPAGFADATVALLSDESAWSRRHRHLLELSESGATRRDESAWPDLVRRAVDRSRVRP